MIHGIYHQNPAQQKTDNAQILLLRMYQFICGLTYAGKLERSLFLKISTGLNRCHGKESSSSQPVLLQVLNTLFCSLFVICNHILQSTAQGSFNGCLITLFHLNQICQNTMDARKAAAVFHKAADTHSIAFIALSQILHGIKTCLCLMQRSPCHVCLLSCPVQFQIRFIFFLFLFKNQFFTPGNGLLNLLHSLFALTKL